MGFVIDGFIFFEFEEIVKEIFSIFDKFNVLLVVLSFGGLIGLNEFYCDNYFEFFVEKKEDIFRWIVKMQVINQDVIDIYDVLLSRYSDYF